MPQSPSILQADPDRARHVAHGVLCLLASFCVLGVLFAWWQARSSSRTATSGSATAPTAQVSPSMPSLVTLPMPTIPASTTPMTTVQSATYQPMAPAPVPGPTALASLPSAPQPTAPPPQPTLPPGKQLKNPQVLEAVNVAREVRRLGDMQAALESLRSAELREPKHPEILAEMALTYEAMGIGSKASALWSEILAMGEAGAGGYHALAKSKTTGGGPAAAPTAPGTTISLGACRAMRDPSVKQGERIAVRVPIVATPGTTIDPALMDIHVFLFESLNNGERIEQVRAVTPTLNWVSTPVNWKDSTEELVDVIYDLPPPKPGETGGRSFHGYLVRLFYQNKLAGERAQPESLRDMAQQRPAAGLDNALFPK